MQLDLYFDVIEPRILAAILPRNSREPVHQPLERSRVHLISFVILHLQLASPPKMAIPVAPASFSEELDQANASSSSDPAKAEQLYRSILSRKACVFPTSSA